jgi:formiminotetrahydrofolate cyclodeaminase
MDYETRPVGAFLDDVASARVTPAGGTAGAVVGAIGTACCEMVCRHLEAAGAGAEGSLAEMRRTLETRRTELLALAAADAEVVEERFAAPTDGADPESVQRSVGVPLSIAEACLRTLEEAATVTGLSDRHVVADAGTAAYLARGALAAAIFTVRSNLDDVDDGAFVAETRERATTIEDAARDAFEETMGNLGPGG